MRDALSPAVFFDRDGTIMEDTHYCSDPNDVRIFPGVPEALRRLKSRGFKVIIITNQSGIGRGLFTLDQYRAVEAEVLRQVGGDLIDAIYYCPDVPGQPSDCRKPAPGMVLKAERDHSIDLSRSFLIGDKEIDVGCAHNANVRAIRVQTGIQPDLAASNADWIADDVAEAVQVILNAKS
ncbi:MAG TPA: HAD family hydrolase [Candidatus Udaeobacter sp.]|jgi:D-glycero-D-manno-heptose 1,7-bisphosphate phosphatase|nr:HAD family hydrolase [Candidatus Udaeobacter sp.]